MSIMNFHFKYILIYPVVFKYKYFYVSPKVSDVAFHCFVDAESCYFRFNLADIKIGIPVNSCYMT